MDYRSDLGKGVWAESVGIFPRCNVRRCDAQGISSDVQGNIDPIVAMRWNIVDARECYSTIGKGISRICRGMSGIFKEYIRDAEGNIGNGRGDMSNTGAGTSWMSTFLVFAAGCPRIDSRPLTRRPLVARQRAKMFWCQGCFGFMNHVALVADRSGASKRMSISYR